MIQFDTLIYSTTIALNGIDALSTVLTLTAFALALLMLAYRRGYRSPQAVVSTHTLLLSHSNGRRGDEITEPLPVVSGAKARPGTSVERTRAAARTDSGRVREVNEDDTLVAELEDNSGRFRCGLYVVADGMGGHEKGEVASHAAIQAAMEAMEQHSFFNDGTYRNPDLKDETVLEVLRDAVMKANHSVYDQRVKDKSDMGTTLVIAMVLHDKVYIANIGDSRSYLIRNGHIRQLTEDHSLVERMVATGQITEAEARQHPQRNLIFRWLGLEPKVEVDMFVERLQPYDRLLLCSDGLNNMLSDAEIGHIVGQQDDLDRACKLLIRAANEAGGRDNISTILVEALPES